MSERLGGNVGCKDKNFLWHSIGFPNGSSIDRFNSITPGRSPLSCKHTNKTEATARVEPRYSSAMLYIGFGIGSEY